MVLKGNRPVGLMLGTADGAAEKQEKKEFFEKAFIPSELDFFNASAVTL